MIHILDTVVDKAWETFLTTRKGTERKSLHLIIGAFAILLPISILISATSGPTASAAPCLANGQSPYPPSADVVISPSSPITGQTFSVSATSFPVNRNPVTIAVGGTAVQISSTSGNGVLAPGSFTAGPVGTYTVLITDSGSPAINCAVTISVIPVPPSETTTPTTTAPTTTTTPPPTTTTPATTTTPTTTTTPLATTTPPPTTTTPPPTTTTPATTTTPPATTTPPPTTTLPPAPPPTLAPAPPPEPIDPGGTVNDGNLGVVRSDEPAAPPVVVADGLAPGSPVQSSVRIPQRIAEVALDSQAFSPTSSFSPAVFVSPAGDSSAIPVLGTPTPPTALGNDAVGGVIFNSTKIAPIDLGLTPAQFVQSLGGSSTFTPLPDLDPSDPIITGATNWLLMDVVVTGANPGSSLEVVWFSDPVRLGTDVIDANGDAAFQVAVPDTLITVGETDTLRIFAEYLLDESLTDAQGNSALEVALPQNLREISEPGAQLQLIVRGVDLNGESRVVNVLLPTDDFATPGDQTNWRWLVLFAIIPLAIGIYLVIRRRSQAADENDPDDGDPAIGAATGPGAGTDSGSSSGAAPLDPPIDP